MTIEYLYMYAKEHGYQLIFTASEDGVNIKLSKKGCKIENTISPEEMRNDHSVRKVIEKMNETFEKIEPILDLSLKV